MCLKQTGVDGNRSNNFLYDGDTVSTGKETEFKAKYPNLFPQFAQILGVSLDNDLIVYETDAVSIHGLNYQCGCALVLHYEDDIPIFGIVKNIIVYKKDKYFVIQCTSGQAVLNQHILHYKLEPVDNSLVKSYYSLEFKWPLSVYSYNGEIVTMNINTHTCEIF